MDDTPAQAFRKTLVGLAMKLAEIDEHLAEVRSTLRQLAAQIVEPAPAAPPLET